MLNGKRCAHGATPSPAKIKLFLHHRGAICSLEPLTRAAANATSIAIDSSGIKKTAVDRS